MPLFKVSLVPEASSVCHFQELDKKVNIGEWCEVVAYVAPVRLPSTKECSAQCCSCTRVSVFRWKQLISFTTSGLDGTVCPRARVMPPGPHCSRAVFCDRVQGDTTSQAVKNWSNARSGTSITFRTVTVFELVYGQVATGTRVICVFQGLPYSCARCRPRKHLLG